MRFARTPTRTGRDAFAPASRQAEGSFVRRRGRLIKHCSSTQKTIALSSAEAELYSATRASSEAQGLKCIGEDFGESLAIRAYVGAQATIGLSRHAGLGKARHIETAAHN